MDGLSSFANKHCCEGLCAQGLNGSGCFWCAVMCYGILHA
jgi:hypothetical protein